MSTCKQCLVFMTEMCTILSYILFFTSYVYSRALHLEDNPLHNNVMLTEYFCILIFSVMSSCLTCYWRESRTHDNLYDIENVGRPLLV